MRRSLPTKPPLLLTLPAITITIRGGRTELNPGWPLDQILEIEKENQAKLERNQRRKGYLK